MMDFPSKWSFRKSDTLDFEKSATFVSGHLASCGTNLWSMCILDCGHDSAGHQVCGIQGLERQHNVLKESYIH